MSPRVVKVRAWAAALSKVHTARFQEKRAARVSSADGSLSVERRNRTRTSTDRLSRKPHRFKIRSEYCIRFLLCQFWPPLLSPPDACLNKGAKLKRSDSKVEAERGPGILSLLEVGEPVDGTHGAQQPRPIPCTRSRALLSLLICIVTTLHRMSTILLKEHRTLNHRNDSRDNLRTTNAPDSTPQVRVVVNSRQRKWPVCSDQPQSVMCVTVLKSVKR